MIDPSVLSNNSYFSEILAEDEKAYLLTHSTIREYSQGEFLFLEGDPSGHFSLILEGNIEVIKARGTDVERQLKVLGSGEFLGEMSLVYKNHKRTASARAVEPARLLEIPIAEFSPLVQRNPRLAYHLMQTIVERVIATENATIHDLEEKNRLLTQSLIELQAAQEQLLAKERLETELATAYQIQKSMLPFEIPALPGWEMIAHWQPARAVSGDFYDFIPLPDGRMALVIGDVTDKGVPAALLMTVTRSTIRTAAGLADSPGDLLERVNNILCPQMPLSMFATCQVAFLDPAAGRFELANAGHPLPLLYQGGQVREIQARGMSLGIIPGMRYVSMVEYLAPGDCILFYSDGLSEARNPRNEMLDVAGVEHWFLEGAQLPQSMIEFLVQRLADFTGNLPNLEDDVTLVHLHRS